LLQQQKTFFTPLEKSLTSSAAAAAIHPQSSFARKVGKLEDVYLNKEVDSANEIYLIGMKLVSVEPINAIDC